MGAWHMQMPMYGMYPPVALPAHVATTSSARTGEGAATQDGSQQQQQQQQQAAPAAPSAPLAVAAPNASAVPPLAAFTAPHVVQMRLQALQQQVQMRQQAVLNAAAAAAAAGENLDPNQSPQATAVPTPGLALLADSSLEPAPVRELATEQSQHTPEEAALTWARITAWLEEMGRAADRQRVEYEQILQELRGLEASQNTNQNHTVD
eukprot:jgi/Mesen1/5357/ME000267S04505